MRVLIDTNVALTYVSGRKDPFSDEVDLIMQKCAMEEIEGALAFHSLSTIWYQTRKLPEATRRDWIRQLCELLTVLGADNKAVIEAVNDVKFKDFEDALQDCCAKAFEADYTITANTRDYNGVSKVPAITPREFLELK